MYPLFSANHQVLISLLAFLSHVLTLWFRMLAHAIESTFILRPLPLQPTSTNPLTTRHENLLSGLLKNQ